MAATDKASFDNELLSDSWAFFETQIKTDFQISMDKGPANIRRLSYCGGSFRLWGSFDVVNQPMKGMYSITLSYKRDLTETLEYAICKQRLII